MFKLTLLEALLVTHILVDWIFQWKWEAMNKSKKWLPLFFHCTVYTVGFIPVFLIYKISLAWLVLLFVSHVVLDRRKFEIWLLENFKGIIKKDTPEAIWTMFLIATDQILHVVILVLIVIFN